MLIYFLPAILALGIITSYEDIKFGKIRNKYIIFALLYTIIAYTLILTLSDGIIDKAYLIEALINIIIALIIGFIIWHIGLWTSGDAKLFLAYSALLPLSLYSLGYVRYFPSFIILINTFVPVFLFFFLMLIFKTNFKQKKESLKSIFKPKQLGTALISLFAIFWIIQIIFSLIKIKTYFLAIAISLLIFFSIKKIFKKSFLIIVLIISSLRFIFDQSVYSLEFIKQFSMLFIFWILIRGFILDLGYQLFSKEISINNLKPKMILAELIYKEKDRYKKEKQMGLFSFLKKDKRYLFKIMPEGLTKENINKIKKIDKEKKLNFKTIKIQQTVSFAPFIFLGVLLTILAKGNILILVKFLISRGFL